MKPLIPPPVAAETWRYPKPYGLKTLILSLMAMFVLWQTAVRVELPKAVALTAEAVGSVFGSGAESQVAKGFATVAGQLFPLEMSERVEVSRIENFDRENLPAFSYIEHETTEVETLNPDTLEVEAATETTEILVKPYGYLMTVGVKMLETLEIALWGTILAVILGLPLALLGASNLAPNRWVQGLSRSVVSLLRAVPELISALFLVLAYGFGPMAGILALALHAAGFFGKFYADDIEAADPKPQEALRAIGAGCLKVFRHAILPMVWPNYIASTLYILDRNVRMATVIGLVGAGGIGQELKGRYDMYDYGHVGTILVAIFVLVLILEQISVRLRKHYL
ncbi:phosphonate ABC transporter, permease protein PhnE [Asticcacaulis machinosus]|uniref:Phosphonate ABC transporter, permease protein PhnE n=1 Tax=Asticcacaulis machinosus TaxID=2984211 RepID=A0ABT5HH13_9CAUL|nr:phosphonate ABC transporter, permease protein PhnE [Asticcacaulis machinosus]MDC7675545.1 phosphonate ABC transporter, permease protein PhnE [Asticcacaulis machinosus]